MKKRILFIIKLLIFLVIFFYLFKKTNFSDLLNNLSKVKIVYLILSMFLSAFTTFLMSTRQRMILGLKGVRIGRLRAFLINYYAQFINNFFFGFVGGDAYTTMSIEGDKKTVVKGVLLDRLTGMFVLILMSVPGVIFYFFNRNEYSNVVQIKIPFAIVLFICFFLVAVYFFIFKKDFFLSKLNSIKKILLHRNILFLAIAIQILMILNLNLIFLSLGWHISYLNLFLFVPLINLIITLPISIKGYGFRELLISVFFGINISEVLVFTIVNTAVTILHTSIGASLNIINNKKN